MSKFCFTDASCNLGTALCEAAGVQPDMVKRIVLDLAVGSPGKVYFDTYADTSVLDLKIDLAEMGIEITAEESA